MFRRKKNFDCKSPMKWPIYNILGAQLSSRYFFDENATLLWENGYKWIIQSIDYR